MCTSWLHWEFSMWGYTCLPYLGDSGWFEFVKHESYLWTTGNCTVLFLSPRQIKVSFTGIAHKICGGHLLMGQGGSVHTGNKHVLNVLIKQAAHWADCAVHGGSQWKEPALWEWRTEMFSETLSVMERMKQQDAILQGANLQPATWNPQGKGRDCVCALPTLCFACCVSCCLKM